MSQIDDLIKTFESDADDALCECDDHRAKLKDCLKAFASEVCKAMLEDCVPEIPKHTNHEQDEYWGCPRCADSGVMEGFRNKIKERAKKWIGVPPKVGTS